MAKKHADASDLLRKQMDDLYRWWMNVYVLGCISRGNVWCNVRGEPTASVLSADGFPLMAGPNFQPSDGNPIVISILRQLANVLENVPEI